MSYGPSAPRSLKEREVAWARLGVLARTPVPHRIRALSPEASPRVPGAIALERAEAGMGEAMARAEAAEARLERPELEEEAMAREEVEEEKRVRRELEEEAGEPSVAVEGEGAAAEAAEGVGLGAAVGVAEGEGLKPEKSMVEGRGPVRSQVRQRVVGVEGLG